MKKSLILASSAILLAAISAGFAIFPSYRNSSLQVSANSSVDLAPVSIPVSDTGSHRSLEVGEFSFKELQTVNPQGGCGMSLWKPTQERVPQKIVFFNGLKDEGMWMKIDGRLVKFQRIASSGEEFYGQTTTQIFQNEDKSLRVEVTVELGAVGEIESIAIASALLRVERFGKIVELAVVGDAGC